MNNNNLKKILLATRLQQINKEIEGLADEKEELRKQLSGLMEYEEEFLFETTEGPYRARLCATEEIHLKDFSELDHILTTTVIYKSAKISVGKLKKVIAQEYKDQDKAANVFRSCIFSMTRGSILRLLKGR